MHRPTCRQIAESFSLWGEYVDPNGNMTEAEFDALTSDEKVAQIHGMFPTDCNCEE